MTKRARPSTPTLPVEPDGAPYGPALAAAVADTLARGHVLAYDHRDYCGMGLRYVAKGAIVWSPSAQKDEPAAVAEYQYGSVDDGYFLGEPQRFAARADFVAWLGAQSDRSLHGAEETPFFVGNQRVSRARLEEFVRAPPARR